MGRLVRLTFWRLALMLALGAVAYISLAPSSGGSMFVGMDKLAHCLIYAALYVLAWLAFPGSVLRWSIHLGLLSFGIALELLQSRTGYRFMEGADVVANTTGTGLGNLVMSLLVAGRSGRRSRVSLIGENRK